MENKLKKVRDKGLIITTGTVTNDAKAEAQMEGAPPTGLADGQVLADKIKGSRLGVEIKERIIEGVIVHKEFFESF